MVRVLRCLYTACLVGIALAGTPLPADESTLDASLIAQYHFDEFEGATAFLDSSFSGNNGSCTGTTCPVTGELGVFGSAARFDGGNDYIIVADNANLDNTASLSVQIWFFPTTVDGQPDGLVSKRVTSGSNESYSLFLYTSNRLNVDIHGTNNRFFTTTAFTANRWYHVTVVFDGSQVAANRVRVYINGREDSGSPFTEASATIPNQASSLHLGMLNAAYGNGFHGLIDEVSIYNAVLTTDEVQNFYRDGAWRIHNHYLGSTGTLGRLLSGLTQTISPLWRVFPQS